MDRARERSVVFISAPAGSGKTTLVSSYIQEKKIPCLWYCMDGGDADPATFFYYLGLAGKAVANASEKMFPVFRPEQTPCIKEFSRKFFSKIYTCLPPQSLVIFDEFQEPGEALFLHTALLAALDRIPNGVTLVFLSRFGPPTSFRRLLANRLGAQLQWEDLRFTFDEFKEVLSVWHAKVPQNVVNNMYQTMDGWVAGLHLITETSNNIESGQLRVNSLQEVFDYFSFEVFAQFDRRLQEYLVKTAFVSALSVSMAKAISTDSQAGMFLQRLHRNNYFTFQKRQVEDTYQYHPLFRDFLLQQASRILADEDVEVIHYTAVDLLLAKQRHEEAVACLRQLHDWDRLVEIILETAPALLAQGRNLALQNWISFVPKKRSKREPWLLFWDGAAIMTDNPKKSYKIISYVFQHTSRKKFYHFRLSCKLPVICFLL